MKFKRLIPALAMLLVSAILLGTSTFAWFSMNTQVTAANMQVRAVAEQGLLINEVATATDPNWDNLADANQVGTSVAPLSQLYPASTADGSTWYHAASTKSASAASATQNAESADIVKATGATTGYETLPALNAITNQSIGATAGSQAKFDTMGKLATDTAGYYVHYEYYLKSSSSEIDLTQTGTGAKKITIKEVKALATANNSGTGASGSTNLNKAVRVGIKVNSAFYVYAPLADTLSTYYVGPSHSSVTPIGTAVETTTDLETLPASSAAGAKVDVYIWYEGEDANCMTDNATAAILDNIKVDITFALKTL